MRGVSGCGTGGLVLLEALVAIAILAVLAALAVPGFAGVTERFRVRGAVEALTSSLYLARAEAFKRGGRVTLSTATGADCDPVQSGTQWECGWMVFADDNENGKRDDLEDILQSNAALPGLEVRQTSRLAALEVNAWGQFNGLGAIGFVLRSKADLHVSSVICVSSAGRVRVQEGVDEC